MSGSVSGGKKAAASNKRLYGEDFFRKIGQLGGRISRGGGFARDNELAKEAGRRGGKAPRRLKDGSQSKPVQASPDSGIPEFFTTTPQRPKCEICSQRHATALCPEAL